MKYFFLTLLFTSRLFAIETNLDLSDVSILFPLPKTESWNQLPSGKSPAKFGELLPLSIFKQLPQLLSLAPNERIYSAMHVVGVRVDPCFHEGPTPLKCHAQIRMVWQPLADDAGETSTFDAAIHTFYDLTTDEFKDLLNSLQQHKSSHTQSTEFKPLGINPILKSAGLESDYYKNLIKIIFQFTGEKKLSRVTFMQLFMNGNIWEFGGFDISNSSLKPINIPRINAFTQKFKNSASPRPIWFNGGMAPEPQDVENLNILTRDSRVLAPQNEAEIIEATKSAFKFENPTLHNPGTVDCVSCHIAQSAKIWSMRQYPWLNLDVVSKNEIYASDRDIRNLSPMQIHTNILRSFGYFMDIPFVAQRTINESAEVIKYINSNF